MIMVSSDHLSETYRKLDLTRASGVMSSSGGESLQEIYMHVFGGREGTSG